MYAIQVRGLRKSYGGVDAVGGVDLDVRRGEVFALLGPNGAGKTTTVEILEGHRPRDSGEVDVLGADPATAGRAWRARLGIVLQTANDAAELTVRESVRHYAGHYPDPAPVDEVIEQVGLTAKAGARVKSLSGGQRRRLDVALGVVGRPELVFLDEPTTGFDPEARRQFWELIRNLAAGGTTIVLTTHYLDEAEALADRVAVIAGGRIVAEGTPATLGGRSTAKATVSWLGPNGRETRLTDTPTALIRELTENQDRAGDREPVENRERHEHGEHPGTAERPENRDHPGTGDRPENREHPEVRAHPDTREHTPIRELPELTVTRPSLEDTYLSLIGDPR